MNRVVLVTGTSTGLGLELSVLLAKAGDRVYATMRNLAKQDALLERAKSEDVDVHVLQLDVQDWASVQAAVSAVIEREGRLDVLINNAGAGLVRTTEEASLEEIQWQVDVNLMGVIRCTKAALPWMRKARSGHVVNITSVGGLVGQPFNEIYCATKFAVEGYTEAMASYIQPEFGVTFTLVEPGGITSNFAANVLAQFESTGGMRDDEYSPLLQRYIGNAQSRMGEGVYQSAEEVAQVVVDCLNDPNPPLRVRTSAWAEAFCELKTKADPTGRQLSEHVYKTLLGA